MRIYIDSNTFPAAPGLYADAAKTKPIPRMIPAVELQRGGFEVAFVGSNQPTDIASVSLAASIEGVGVQVIAEQGESVSDDNGDAWRFNFALNADSLVAEVAKRGSVRLRVGVIVEDDTERLEWQFSTVVYPSASSEETDTEAVESAKNFAELAEQAAKRAKEAQVDVAGNAQLAEKAKQTATQAANAAIEAADNAEVSERNAAESKGAAEKAKTDAEAAKAEAKKAASDAQATLGNVYTKSQIDGVDTGAEVTLKMNEIIAQLKDWEEITGVNLQLDFYGQLMEEFQKWQENPVRKNWNTTSATESNNPFNSSATSKPIIAWNLECKGLVSYPSFSADILGLVFLSGVGSAYCAMVKSKNSSFVYCDSEDCFGFVRNSSGSPTLYLPNATTISQIAAYTGKPTVYAPKAKNFRQAFYNNSRYNIAVDFPSGEDGSGAFSNTAMSAENISKTLDSLPPWTDGASHVITFTGSPGCAELTQESPSVAAAVAKGWTVEL